MKYEMSIEAIRILEFTTNMIDECTDLFLKVFTQEPWNDEWASRQDAKKYLESHYAFNNFLGYVAILDNRVAGVSWGLSNRGNADLNTISTNSLLIAKYKGKE